MDGAYAGFTCPACLLVSPWFVVRHGPQDGHVEIIANAEGSRTMASCVAFTESVRVADVEGCCEFHCASLEVRPRVFLVLSLHNRSA